MKPKVEWGFSEHLSEIERMRDVRFKLSGAILRLSIAHLEATTSRLIEMIIAPFWDQGLSGTKTTVKHRCSLIAQDLRGELKIAPLLLATEDGEQQSPFNENITTTVDTG